MLPERQVPDLTFPFTGIAAFREQDNVLDGGPHRDSTAHFEDARHSLTFHDTAVGLRRHGRNIMCQEHAVMIRRVGQRPDTGQPDQPKTSGGADRRGRS